MNVVVISILLVAAALLAIKRGPAASFAYLFVPVLLLLSIVKPVVNPILPDLGSLAAVAVGTFGGAVVAGKLPAYRFHFIDLLVIGCSASMTVTAGVNGNTWTVVSATCYEILRWILPYFMARAVFREPDLRRHLAISVAYIAMFMGFISLIEFRLRPLFFSRILEDFGLSTAYNTAVLGRFNFFRAMVTTEHPIDFGNTGFMMAAIIIAMGTTSGLSMRDWRIVGGVGASLLCVATSMSFSSYIGCAVAVGLFVGLRYVRGSEWVLVPSVAAAILGGVLFTQYLLSLNLESMPRQAAGSREALDDSFYIRTLIAQNAWNNAAKDAGWVGFGDQLIGRKELGLESVDNSYMLFLIRRGWVHLILRFTLAISIAAIGTQMLRGARGHAMRTPPAALTAALLGTMVSMYTVWFGFVYAVFWTCALAIAVTMRQVIAERKQSEVFALLDGRGFPVGPPASTPSRPMRPMAGIPAH